ncbi:MAG: GreA/GreB family elongation factor [Candidatus Saccharimonadales bacterium]
MQTYNNTYLTVGGLEKLKEHIQSINKKRFEVGHELHDSHEPGRRIENGSYVSTLEKKLQLENSLQNINHTIQQARVIKKPKDCNFIRLGSQVKIKGNKSVKTYMIVDSPEVNPSRGFISYKSPAGASLMNKRVGDRVEIGGQKTTRYTILAIS